MKLFKMSYVDGCWICKKCGVAVTPTPEEASKHIELHFVEKRGKKDGNN